MTDHEMERSVGDSGVCLREHGSELRVLIFKRGIKGRNIRAAAAEDSELSDPPTFTMKSNIFRTEKTDHFGAVEVARKGEDRRAIASRCPDGDNQPGSGRSARAFPT